MINVTISNNVERRSNPVSADTTIRQAIESVGFIDISRGCINLDGSSLAPGDLNKTFGELGYTGEQGHDRVSIFQVVKANNA